MKLGARLYLAAVTLTSIGFLVAYRADINLQEHLVALVLLTAASFLAQVYELEILPHFGLSTQIALALAAVYIGGLPLGIGITFLSTVPAEILLRWEKLKEARVRFVELVAFNSSQLVLSAVAAAVVFEIVTGFGPFTDRKYVAMVCAFLAYMLVNNSLVAAIVSLSSEESFTRVLRFGLRNLPLQFLTMGVLAILMYTLHEEAPLNLGLVFVPLALVHYSVHSYLRLQCDSHNAFRKITELLSRRDQCTGTHSDDVEVLAVTLAQKVGFSDDLVEAIRLGAAIHDIGKMAIPDAVLNKLGPLAADEYETMKTHAVIGSEIIGNISIYRDVVPMVRHEHEHWDGTGYPDGLMGEDIPIAARVLAVADVYSALTTEREYRPAQGKPLKHSWREAISIMAAMAGTVLDPALVDVFVRDVLRQRIESKSAARR